MEKYTKKEFKKFSLNTRYKLLKQDGEYLGTRLFGSHRVSLYAIYGFFVEMWIILFLDKVQWIEIQENQSIINEYIKDLDIKKDLNL